MKQRSVQLLRDETGNQAQGRRAPTAVRSASGFDVKSLRIASSSSLSSSSSSLAVKKKADELFRRLQPHTLVQLTEKLLSTLKIAPKLFANGEELLPISPPARTVAAAAATGNRRPASTTAAWSFKPETGRFRYGLSLQYLPSDPEISLSSLETLHVTITSTAMQKSRQLPLMRTGILNAKSWKLVAETEDHRIGLALYEISFGDWNASSLVALVWTEKLEIARLFIQLHTTEMLYSAPQRALQVRRDDDLDRKHGLHSYTAAITLRSFDELFWEREAYHIEFSAPEASTRNVTAQLLDNILGFRVARDRELTSETEPALKVETEAVNYAMCNCILVDFTLWDDECIPLWGFSRALELMEVKSRQQSGEDGNIDLSVSSAGDSMKSLQLRFQDNARGNSVSVSLTKMSSSQQHSTKKANIWVSQVELTLSVDFINTTFGTEY